jgi:uncharacterized membrane protein YgdD (TMEM256/DUF423 family)
MSVTADRPRAQADAARNLRIVSVAHRRQPPWIVAGILLVAGCAFGAGQLYLRSTQLHPMLALARDVPAGHTLEASDLRGVDAAANGGVKLVPEASESRVLGQPASHDLAAGSLLTQGDVAAASSLSADQAIVAVAPKPGQYPPALSAGDRVAVIDTGTGGALTGSTAPPVTATVLSVDQQPGPVAEGAVVTLRLPAADAAAVASTGAAGRVALVLLAPAQ